MLPAWHVHPDVWLVLGSVSAAYVIACRRHEETTGEPTSAHQRRLFLGGMLVLWLASEWPLHDLSEGYLYSMHMVQHMLYTFLAAPLLVAGTPAWLIRRAIAFRPFGVAFRFLVRPLVALVVFNSVLLFTHWPAVVAASVGSELSHFGLHLTLMGAAYLMWWPIASPLPELPPIPAPGQILYLFLQSLAPTIPASFLTFGHQPLYPVYAVFPRIWGIDPLTDQLIAGLIMKLVGGLILWTVIAVVFFRWGRREEREGFDALGLRDVEREIRSELSR